MSDEVRLFASWRLFSKNGDGSYRDRGSGRDVLTIDKNTYNSKDLLNELENHIQKSDNQGYTARIESLNLLPFVD